MQFFAGGTIWHNKTHTLGADEQLSHWTHTIRCQHFCSCIDGKFREQMSSVIASDNIWTLNDDN